MRVADGGLQGEADALLSSLLLESVEEGPGAHLHVTSVRMRAFGPVACSSAGLVYGRGLRERGGEKTTCCGGLPCPEQLGVDAPAVHGYQKMR